MPTTQEIAAVVQLNQYLARLSVADWNDPVGPMRLSSKLTLADYANASLPANVRLLMTGLEAAGGTAATATGNLNRAFVGQLLDRVHMPEINRSAIRKYNKVVNEMDVWPLHLARVIAELARLIQKRSKRFTLTKTGRQLLAADQTGPFFRTLFIAYFRKFDLNYDFRFRPVPALQSTMAAILWRLDAVVNDWRSLKGLAPQILLPRVYPLLLAAMTHPQFDTEEWILEGHVLSPLYRWGLLERRPADSFAERDGTEIRQTQLWRKFFWFDFQL